MTKEEQLLLVLKRIDEYLGRVDSKANFWITCNIFIIGALVFNSNILSGELQWSSLSILMTIFFILGILFSTTGMLWAFWAIAPFLKSGNSSSKDQYKTLLYFGSISKLSYNKYRKTLKKTRTKDRFQDIEKQTYLLSNVLNKKFEKINKSTQYSLFAFIFTIISVLFKIFIIITGR